MSNNAKELANFLDTQKAVRAGRSIPSAPAPVKRGGSVLPVKASGKVPTFASPKSFGTPPAAPHHGGGGVGGALHSVGSFFGGAAHDTAHYFDLASHDVAAMPAGIASAGGAVAHDLAKVNDIGARATHIHESAYEKKAGNTPWETPALGKAMAKQTYESVRHPLRDPFQALLTIGAAASLGAGTIARAGAAGDAAGAAEEAGALGKAGAAAKAFARKPVMENRFLKVPKNIATKNGIKEMRSEKIQLMHSHKPLYRAAQALHDRIVERALTKTNVEHPSLLYKYGASRIGKATSEVARRSDRVRMTLPFELDRIRKFGGGLTRHEGNLALFLRSANVTPAEAADFWAEHAHHPDTENPALVTQMSELAHSLHQKGALALQDGNVVVSKSAFPRLHEIDKLVKEAQRTRENVIGKHGLLTPEAMHERLGLVARTMGLNHVHPPKPGYIRLYRGEGEGHLSYEEQGLIPGDETHWYSSDKNFAAEHDTGGGLYSVDIPKRVASEHHVGAGTYHLPGTIASKAKEVVEGRQGQGYTFLGSSRKNITPYPRSGSVPVTGRMKNFISKSKIATGKGVRQGVVPDNTAAGVASSLRESLAYLRKSQHRQMVARFGSDFRNTKEDVLVADPTASKVGKIPSSTREALGQEHSTLNTLDSETEHTAGLAAAMEAKLHDMIPHLAGDAHELGEKFQKGQDVGVKAPEGYKWVHKNALGDLAKSVQPRGRLAKKVDTINSAVTAATVYFKLSHVPQRGITDATTSALSGALTSRKSWKLFYELRNTLTPKELNEFAQSTGTHGYSAMPHEDVGVTGRIATSGANFFSKHIDAHFRLLNLVHEARRAGIDDVAGMRRLNRFAKNPMMKTKNAATYEHVLARANRTSMMYDGMTANERRTVARAFWFYPWTKAATRYAGHVAVEHPLTAAAGAEVGHKGRDYQGNVLGNLPSFEYGLVPYNHKGTVTGNPGWLVPFNTASNVLEYGARPEQIAGNLNPVYGAISTALGGPNSFGESGQPHPIGQALSELASPTPEARIINDFLHKRQIERKTRMFPHDPLQDVWTSLVAGPAYPKRTTKKALHFAHKKERGGFRDILIPK